MMEVHCGNLIKLLVHGACCMDFHKQDSVSKATTNMCINLKFQISTNGEGDWW